LRRTLLKYYAGDPTTEAKLERAAAARLARLGDEQRASVVARVADQKTQNATIRQQLDALIAGGARRDSAEVRALTRTLADNTANVRLYEPGYVPERETVRPAERVRQRAQRLKDAG